MSHARHACAKDESTLRRLAAAPMPGNIQLAFPHEPDFFAAEKLKGDTIIPLVLTDDDDQCVGVGVTIHKRLYRDGEAETVGYLGSLRSEAGARRRLGLMQGFRLMREIHRQKPLACYYTSIISANTEARRLFEAGRPGMPYYQANGEIFSFGVNAAGLRHWQAELPQAYQVTDGRAAGMAALKEFYAAAGPKRDLFPVWPEELPPGLCLEDMVVLWADNRIMGAAALWDQRRYRQIRVTGYGGWLGRWRGVINFGCRWYHYPLLPKAGEELPYCYLAYAAYEEGDARWFGILLREAGKRLRGEELLFFALHETDPALPQLRRLRGWRYRSILYRVDWDMKPKPLTHTPYFELATV